jgi:hypothetical protein
MNTDSRKVIGSPKSCRTSHFIPEDRKIALGECEIDLQMNKRTSEELRAELAIA